MAVHVYHWGDIVVTPHLLGDLTWCIQQSILQKSLPLHYLPIASQKLVSSYTSGHAGGGVIDEVKSLNLNNKYNTF